MYRSVLIGLDFLTGEYAPEVKVSLRVTFDMAQNAMKATWKSCARY